MYGGPRASGERRHVLETEERFDSVGKAINARLAQCFGEIEAGGGWANGWPAELRCHVRDMKVQCPVLQLIAHRTTSPGILEIVRRIYHDLLKFVSMFCDPNQSVVRVLRPLSLTNDVETYFA